MSADITQSLLNNSVLPKKHIIERYIKFINRCKNIKFSGYTENHHIIPRSFGGLDDTKNLINLSARHHFIAHLLLAKATNSPKMIKALHRMVYSTKNNPKKSYKITSKVYAFIREQHAKIVGKYSKDTVVAKQIYTEEIKRIPIFLFKKYNGILYEAISKGRKDSQETKIKKQISSKKPRKVKQRTRSRSLAASKFSYETPLGFCENSTDLLKMYPSFTKNTLTVLKNNAIISSKFASIHKEFSSYIGKTFEEYGIIKQKRT